VRRRLAFAGVLVAAVVGAGAARADWQVHRDGSHALVDRAEQALRDRPDDDALARRLAQIVGRKETAGLRERFRARAAASTGYAPMAAYAQLLLALRDAAAAATAFGEALRVSPDARAALAGRARALAMARSPEAVAAYEAAIKREARPPARRRLIEAELALLALPALSSSDAPGDPAGDARGADPEQVVRLRRELARLAPDSDRAAEQLAEALERTGRPSEAAAILEQRIPPHHLLAKLSLVLRATRLRLADRDASDAARAAETLRALLREIPRGAAESRRAAWACAREVARARGTLGALAEAMAEAPGPVEWDLLGQVREELGDLEGALAATQKAKTLAPGDVALGDRLLRLLDRLGRDQEAIVAAQDLARRFPLEIRFSIALCERQWRHGDRAAADTAFERALGRFSHQPTALQTLAENAARRGDDKRALAAWTQLVRVDPTSEVAVVGLGEAQFQAGKRDDARRTWATVRKRAASPAKAHLRLGELLFDHELLNDAIEEAQRAKAADAADAGPHRLLAQIDERQHKLDDAVAEWRQVLSLAHDPLPEAPGLRREARTRLLALLGRQGRGKVDAEVHRLSNEASAHPDDTETEMFLAEAEQRLGDTAAATATLQAITARGAVTTDRRVREAGVEAGFALVRLLKQSGQLAEAAAHLGSLALLSPARASEAELQIADLALVRYDLPGALAHAAAAENGADGPQLIRIAEIRERAGADRLAVATYRRAIARDAGPTAALALARLLERQGDASGAAGAVEALLRSSRDDASVADASRRALQLDEALDRLPDLVEALASGEGEGDGQKATPGHRRALVDVLDRLVPTLYRDPAADEARARLARMTLRPLLDLVITAEVPPRKAVELLGMLGNPDAAPALARIARGGTDRVPASGRGTTSAPLTPASPDATDARAAALVALGRLGDPRGLAPLEEAATAGALTIRAAAVWAIGRIADQGVAAILERAIGDPHPEIQALACLGLGRHTDARTVALLARLGADAARPSELRIAATLALGHAGGPQAAAALVQILDRGDHELSGAAALALAWTRDPRALPALLARALLPGEFALASSEAPLAALAAWQTGGPPPDEARSITGNDLSIPAMLATLLETAPAGDLTPLWRAHTGEIDAILSDALARGTSARRAALEALDARTDGLALGALMAMGDAPSAPETAVAAREIAWPLADGIAPALDDPDRRTRALALRVLAKLDDERLTPARLADAIADGAPVLTAAALSAAQILVRAHPALATPIAAAVAPLVAEDGSPSSWSCRLAAVELLASLGPPGLPPLDRAVNDRNALVRAAALEAVDRARPSGPRDGPGDSARPPRS
jgi:tetratricopeptide (TPR) repeat protein